MYSAFKAVNSPSRGPIHEETIPLRVSAFDKFPIKAGIDRGSSLTKIAFVPKDTPADADTVQLRCLTYLNDDFIDALHVMKEQAQLPDEGKLHITGVGAATNRGKIKEIIGLDVEYINEVGTLAYGVFLLMNHTEPQDVLYPVPDFKKWAIDSAMLDEFWEGTQKNVVASEEHFPAIVVCMGSGFNIMSVDKDGVATYVGGNAFSGKPFMGLANILLGTTNYDEIMKLAEEGDPTATDTTAGDLIQGDSESPYGSFPPEVPMFPFGKASEKLWDRRKCKRADLATSLVSLYADGVVHAVLPVISTTSINKIYISGNGFRHELPRKLIHEKLTVNMGGFGFDLKFLKTGHQGVVAAMFMEPEDIAKVMK